MCIYIYALTNHSFFMGTISLDISVTAFSFFIAVIKLMERSHPVVTYYAHFSVFVHNFQQINSQFTKEI